MAWKSRETKEPPASFFAEVAAYLDHAYPAATVSRMTMARLRPFLVEEWRDGKNGRGAAQATCACDGMTIVPSPATALRIERGEFRPPVGAQRGEVFGADELRDSAKITALRQELAMAKVRARRSKAAVDAADLRLNRARAESTRSAATVKRAVALREHAKYLTEINTKEKELRQLLLARESRILDEESARMRVQQIYREAVEADERAAEQKKAGRGSRKPAAPADPTAPPKRRPGRPKKTDTTGPQASAKATPPRSEKDVEASLNAMARDLGEDDL